MKKLLVMIPVAILLVILFYCLMLFGVITIELPFKHDPSVEGKETFADIELHTDIETGQKRYVEQMQNIEIIGTDDWFIITSEVRFEVPEHPPHSTISFSIFIPYTFHVDGVDYPGIYELGDVRGYLEDDNNRKYRLEVLNLTRNYETQILITEKH